MMRALLCIFYPFGSSSASPQRRSPSPSTASGPSGGITAKRRWARRTKEEHLLHHPHRHLLDSVTAGGWADFRELREVVAGRPGAAYSTMRVDEMRINEVTTKRILSV